MKITLQLRDDIIALLEHFQRASGSMGVSWPDTKVSFEAVGDRSFVATLRKWDGGPKSPTMERVSKFENFLRDQLGEAEYDEFRKAQGRLVAEGRNTRA